MAMGLALVAGRFFPNFSSQASSLKQQFQRLLSFGSTDGQEGSSIADDAQASPSADEENQQLPAPPPAGASMEVRPSPLHIQLDARPSDADSAGEEADSRHVRKSVQAVALFLSTVSFALTVTQPARAEHSRLLFATYTTSVYVTLSMGIGLSVHSIVSTAGTTATWIQKRVMVVGLGFMAAAFVLRTCIVLPMSDLASVWVFFFLMVLAIFLSLLFAWNNRNCDSPAAPDPGGAV